MGSPVIGLAVTPRMAAHARSLVTNGKGLFGDATVDGRSSWARRLRITVTETVLVKTEKWQLCRH